MVFRSAFITLVLLTMAGTGVAQNQPAAPLAAPTGNAQRGKVLFESSLRCYACHGFDGQTGSPRLVPMSRAEDIFLAYVRKPATQGMPSFVAQPEADLRDVYAYIRSIPQAAPAADSVPVIKGVLDRRTKAN
ncbi:MAG TPA: cytochrome c [Vicinamibacterales bacterium]|jgi:mono/diheme cytochrome c family protein|nr:cytochrome c [Vicinamibacterales bacterium]